MSSTMPDSTHRYRVAVLGLGHWYSAYGLARALPEYPRAELVAVAEPDTVRRETYARTFGIDASSDYASVIARADVDVVQIAAPVRDIAALTIQAARAGKHIVMGKPMAMTLAEADAMVEAVEASGVVCVPFQGIMRLRHQHLKARLDAGEIGELAVLHQTSRWSIAEDAYRSGTPGWFVDPAQVPGGAFIDEGIYCLDLFRWLTGSEAVSVDARMRNIVHRDIPVEDWGFGFYTFASGVTATLEASWTICAPRRTGPSPKYNSVVRLEMVGTAGELHDQSFRAPGIAVLGAGAADWVYERRSEEPFATPAPSPLDHLNACLDTGQPPVATIRDARASFVMALGAYQSHREGGSVRLG